MPHLSWDNVIALGYAAEQLRLAAQVLTSDTIAAEYGVQKSCDHLQRLLEHRDLLPAYLILWIQKCLQLAQSQRTASARSNGEVRERARQLSGRILQVLDEVRRVLNAQANQPVASEVRVA